MSEIASTASTRCSQGWRLFWAIGDYYTIEIMKESQVRNWKDYQKAVDKHREHIQGCEDCTFGITRVKIELEDLAREGPDRKKAVKL